MMFPALRLRRGIVCQQAVELVTGYLESTLARVGRRRFEAHLAGCPHCTEYLAQMRETIELTGSLTPGDLPPANARRGYRDLPAMARRAVRHSRQAREPAGCAGAQGRQSGVWRWRGVADVHLQRMRVGVQDSVGGVHAGGHRPPVRPRARGRR